MVITNEYTTWPRPLKNIPTSHSVSLDPFHKSILQEGKNADRNDQSNNDKNNVM